MSQDLLRHRLSFGAFGAGPSTTTGVDGLNNGGNGRSPVVQIGFGLGSRRSSGVNSGAGFAWGGSGGDLPFLDSKEREKDIVVSFYLIFWGCNYLGNKMTFTYSRPAFELFLMLIILFDTR